MSFPNYRDAVHAGVVRMADDVDALAQTTGLPPEELGATLDDIQAFKGGTRADPFGRDFTSKPSLSPPYRAVKVTGALFHTQGGLVIDSTAHVVTSDGATFKNLLAGGGAACGVSGPPVDGYLSGNGLLTAIAFGFLAGANLP